MGRIREVMKEKGAQAHLISSLYDIAWILNLRGNDISHVPVFLSFLLIEEDACTAVYPCRDTELMKFVLIWQTMTLRFVLMMRFTMQQQKLQQKK